MIAKFNNAADLMAHYATIRARLHGPVPKVVVHAAALPPPPPEPEPEPVAPLSPDISKFVMAVIPMNPESIRINFDEVVELVCNELGYTRAGIFANRRIHKLCFDRQMLWALAHKHCLHLSLPQIGRASGGRDHTTVLHGRRKGVTHPEFKRLDESLQTLLTEKHRQNNGLMQRKAVVDEEVC